MDWFILSIASFSLTIAYLEAPFFEKFRNKIKTIHPDLVECAHCSGFWIAMIVYIIFFKFSSLFDIVLHGLFSSGMIIFYDKLVIILLALGRRLSDGSE